MSTNTNNYSTLGIATFGPSNGAQYVQESNTYVPDSRRTDGMIMALNPNDRAYAWAIQAFDDNHLLSGPNQNINPGYYMSIGKAYGPPPIKTQAARSCTGSF